MRNILGGVVYKFKKGQIPAEVSNPKEYKYCYCDRDWQPSFIMADMWVCDAEGNIDPGLDVSPIPVNRDSIGDEVKSFSPTGIFICLGR